MQTNKIKLMVEFDDGYVGQILTPNESDFGTLKDMYIFSTGDKITDANVTTVRMNDGRINVGYIDGEMILIENGGDSPYHRPPRVAESKDYFENIVAELKVDSGKVTVNTLDRQDEYMVIQGLSNLLDYVCRANMHPEIKKIDFSSVPDDTFRKFMRGDTFETSDDRKIKISSALRSEKYLEDGKKVDNHWMAPSPFINSGTHLRVDELRDGEEIIAGHVLVYPYEIRHPGGIFIC